MKEGGKDIVAGLAALVAVAAVFSYATWGQPLAALGGYGVTARFERVDGIITGSQVQLAGVPVGEVTGLRYVSDSGRAEVAMRLGAGVRVPADSVVAIVSDGLLGDKFLRIDPGADERALGDGDRFDFTQNSIDLIGIFQKLVESAERRRGIDPDKPD